MAKLPPVSYSLIFDERAKADLRLVRQAPKKVVDAIRQRLADIERKPKSFNELTKPLSGFRKVKVTGNYRIIYSVEEQRRQVLIMAIGPREYVYHLMLERLGLN